MTDNSSLLKELNLLKPIIQVGKQGLTESVVQEIKKHLKKRKLIKIKCLRYYVDALDIEGTNKTKVKSIADELAKALDCEIVQIRGFTISLYYGNSS